jgi:ABC transporter substrate binding protein
LREVVPNIRRLAIMVNPGFRDVVLEANEVQALAQPLGIEVATLKIWRGEEITPALESLKDHPDALYVPSDATFNFNRIAINTFALNARLPTMLAFRELVETGGLMCYGPNYTSMFRHAGEYVDKILRGAKPADMPVRAADQVRPHHQSDHRQGARAQRSTDAARTCRRGHRITTAICCICSGQQVALFVESLQCTNSGAIGDTADMPRTGRAYQSDVNDPTETLAAKIAVMHDAVFPTTMR